jgi:hypothetical protein
MSGAAKAPLVEKYGKGLLLGSELELGVKLGHKKYLFYLDVINN